MKKLFIILLIIISSSLYSQTITYLKVADRADYELYKKYCNDTIVVYLIQYGKATIVNTNTPGLNYEMYKLFPGEYAGNGGYRGNLLKDTVWFKPWKYGTKVATRSYGTNDYPIQRLITTKVLRRVASVNDYYKSRSTLIYK